eukprot:TRINITY_DN31165_c0_g2_i3.p1 TRINITY_DN31165_c0_g2~~TRINITY_DN31165_c0_g2_i3.p1  ORF type:complete len:196 (+),score=26.77 TRINITY_DN31165_c0_g2_i3:99-686(+)
MANANAEPAAAARSVAPQSPQSLVARWPVLLLTCAGLFGQFYAFDNPSALNEQLKAQMAAASPQMSDEMYSYYFNVLYSAYSVPNVILPLIMGVAVDKCGCRLLICGLGFFVLLGHIVFAMGVERRSWSAMILGRFLFGVGGESMQVAQNCLLFRWFSGKEVAVVCLFVFASCGGILFVVSCFWGTWVFVFGVKF